jgi:hypothetical protein
MQTRRSSTVVLRLVAMLALVGALALLGCPSDDEDDAVVIGSRVVAVRPANADVLGGQTFIFPRGVRAFGTENTQVAFNAATDDDPAASLADITAPGGTASAGAEYGSCIFDVIDSTFERGPLRPEGPPIEISVCTLVINGGQFTVGGPSGPCTLTLTLGVAVSEREDATCLIDLNGDLVVNGTTLTGSVGVGS